MTVTIAPSLLAADASAWGQEIRLIDDEGVKCLHLDIMDGRFVPNLTFGAGPIGMLRAVSDMEFDAHMMVYEPGYMIPDLRKAGVNGVTVHYEACAHVARVLQVIREEGMKPGVAINPGTPVEMLSAVLPFVDRVLVMTVNPGFGGQKAILSMLKKVTWLKNAKASEELGYEIQVDGGVTKQNICSFIDAGAENIVIGSALFQAGRTRDNIREFREILGRV